MESSEFADGKLPELQFTTHEPVGPEAVDQGLSCIGCKQPIVSTYFALGDQVLCSNCRDVVVAPPKGSGLVRFVKAAAFGTLAGLLGALIWYLIRIVANLEIGLVAILVGFMVGKAVHRASAGKGGIIYQVLAVLITYGCIAANYAPDIFQAMMIEVTQRENDQDELAKEPEAIEPEASAPNEPTTNETENKTVPAESANEDAKEAVPAEEGLAPANPGLGKVEPDERKAMPQVVKYILVALITFVFALAVPVMMGMESPIGLLIVGFALWEAWKFSAHRPLPITGPYQAGAARVGS